MNFATEKMRVIDVHAAVILVSQDCKDDRPGQQGRRKIRPATQSTRDIDRLRLRQMVATSHISEGKLRFVDARTEQSMYRQHVEQDQPAK